MSTSEYTITVLGGAGAMGRISVQDLFATAPTCDIVIADADARAATALARRYKSKRVRGLGVDVTNPRQTARALRGSLAVIVALPYRFNLVAMEAALLARCHYVDLGGLFHVTREQLRLHKDFKRADRLALLGMGAAPGITNLLAKTLCDTMDSVRDIDLYVGGVDRTPMAKTGPLDVSYSLATILDEASQKAAVFRDGRMTFVPAMSGAEAVQFPKPVGARRPAYTLHSEVATLPRSFRHLGVRNVAFRIAFDDVLDDRLRFVAALGLAATTPLAVGRAKTPVVPIEVLMALIKQAPKPEALGPPDQYEILRAVVRGQQGGKAVARVLDCHVRGVAAWEMGVDVDTGCPPSIAVQMLAQGAIEARGALPPEVAMQKRDVQAFFKALRRRDMTLRRSTLV